MVLFQQRVCLAVPVFNEGPLISESIIAFLSATHMYTLLIVNDGSNQEDSTLLHELAENLDFKLISHEKNLGYGAACRTAGKWALDRGYEWVIFADSDLSNPVKEIAYLASILGTESVDVYKANRFGSAYGMEEVKFSRKFLSHFASFISTAFIGNNIADPTNGFRAVRARLFSEFNLISDDFSIILEEVKEYLRLNLEVRNFESILGSRSQAQNPSSFNYSLRLLSRYSIWMLECAWIRARRVIRHF